jgi:hypothetical protein
MAVNSENLGGALALRRRSQLSAKVILVGLCMAYDCAFTWKVPMVLQPRLCFQNSAR